MGSQPKPSLLARRSIVKAAYQVVLTDTAMRAAVAVCLLAGTSQAVDFRQIMQIQAMQSRFQQDKIDSTQQKAMMNLAGFEDMQLLLRCDRFFSTKTIHETTVQGSDDPKHAEQRWSRHHQPLCPKTTFRCRTTGDMFSQGMNEP